MSDGPAGVQIVRIPPDGADRVVDVLREAFYDYPVMRFVLADAGEAYPHRLRTLVGFFVMARALRNEPLLGIPRAEGSGPDPDAELAAAATVSFLDGPPSPPELAVLRDRVWTELGDEARERYERCGVAWSPLEEVGSRHIHLNMIGVRGGARGLGLARRLLDHVHDLSRQRADSMGVTLTTEDPRNVPFYERMGYEVVGHARIAPELETWGMFRRNPHG
jgi:GNAT superfamily N-acetyltransferase